MSGVHEHIIQINCSKYNTDICVWPIIKMRYDMGHEYLGAKPETNFFFL